MKSVWDSNWVRDCRYVPGWPTHREFCFVNARNMVQNFHHMCTFHSRIPFLPKFWGTAFQRHWFVTSGNTFSPQRSNSTWDGKDETFAFPFCFVDEPSNPLDRCFQSVEADVWKLPSASSKCWEKDSWLPEATMVSPVGLQQEVWDVRASGDGNMILRVAIRGPWKQPFYLDQLLTWKLLASVGLVNENVHKIE